MNLPLLLLNRRRRGGAPAFSPLSLFASGEEGAWYEPSTTTCFTDTGGTTPATYGDGVAYLEDLSGNGNHATQVTAGARPILARVPEGGRRNLFTATEDFTSGDWGSALNISASGNRLTATATGAASYIGQDSKTVSGANVSTWEVRYVNNPWVAVNFGGGTTTAAFFDIQNGVKGTEASGYTGTITPLSGGWYRISVTGSPTVASSAFILICDGDNDITCTVSRSVDARFPQVEAGSTATAYQKVVDQYDVTEAGVTSLDYLFDDEADDVLPWTAPADTDYTVAYVNTSGTATILTAQSLSGATDILLDPALVGYVAVDRALTSQETTDLTAYLEALA